MDRPKFGIFGSTLTHDFIRRWPKSIGKTTKKIRSNPEKLQSLSYLNISKSRFYLLSLLTEKYDYFLHYLGNFWQGTGRKNQSVTIRIWHILIYPHDSWSASSKNILVLTLSSFTAIGHKGHFNLEFSNLVAFFSTTPTSLKKSVRIPDAEFNAEFQTPKIINQKARMLSPNCPFSFWNQLN